MFKNVVIIIALCLGFIANIYANPIVPVTIKNDISGGVIEPIQVDRNRISINVYTSNIVTLQLIDANNLVVYDVNISEVSFYTINTTVLPLGTYQLYAKSDNQVQVEMIVLE